jgi:tetratricopeptide (TPR) repeat protein
MNIKVKKLFNSGISSLMAGDYAAALLKFQYVTKYNPFYAEAFFCLGIVYEKNGSNNQAINQYEMATRLKPNFAEAYFHLGLLYINSKRYNLAIKQLEEAIRIRPKWTMAHYFYGIACGMKCLSAKSGKSRVMRDFISLKNDC